MFVGSPDNTGDYNLMEVQGIKVYLAPSLKAAGAEVNIILQGVWFFKELEVYGLKC